MNKYKIALVIQGPFYTNEKIKTTNLIDSAIKCNYFDKIVISTYKTDKISAYKNVNDIEIILNEDPGSQCLDNVRNAPININRQILTTQNGIKKVIDYDFIFKVRSDLLITDSKAFINNFQKFIESNLNYLFCDITTPNYNKPGCMFLFHLSDWVLGLNKLGAIKYLNIPFVDESELSKWGEYNKNIVNKEYHNTHVYTKYSPEQWITLNLINPEKILLKNIFDIDYSNIVAYEKFIQSIFYISLYQLGMRSQKYRYIHLPHSDRLPLKNSNMIYKLIAFINKYICLIYEKKFTYIK